jgi:HSP20 family protein
MSINEIIPRRKSEAKTEMTQFTEFGNLTESFDRLAERLWGPYAKKWLDFPANTPPGGSDLNVKETDKAYEVSAQLPGIDKKNVNVDVRGDKLTIQAEQKEEKRTKNGWSSCSRSFFQSFTLPAGVKAAEVQAQFKDGTLSIQLPKDGSEPSHKVEVR